MAHVKSIKQLTNSQFDQMFPDEDACKNYLVARRWPDSAICCPRCDNKDVYPVTNRPFHWQCSRCAKAGGYRFSVLVGTIFENTNKPLRDWYKVAHLMLSSKKGMSALQIMRYMGFGSYKTAWLMCHKIRTALIEDIEQLGGIVEVDESFIGGKDKNKHWDGEVRGRKHRPSTKTAVIGAVQRKGNVVARVIGHISSEACQAFVREMVSNKVSLLATDESKVYRGLTGYTHKTVDHSKKQYVVGAVHTNTIEGFWSIFKRGVVGTFHKMSAKYMPLYVAEFQFRYNNRANADIFGTAIGGC
jgi:hypothetical protein